MKTPIDVKDRKEGELLRRGLEDPDVRAFVKVMGSLFGLASDRARKRVLEFVVDHLDELD